MSDLNKIPVQNYRAIVFDMDGTLVDSGQLHESTWCQLLAHYHIPLDRELMRSLAGLPTIQTVEVLIEHFKLTHPIDVFELDRLKQEILKETYQAHIKPTKLAELAKSLNGKMPMAVGTGSDTKEAEWFLKAAGVWEYIDFVVGADQVSKHKPHPDTFLRCAELMQVPAQSCLVFEDAPSGIAAATAANMDVIDVAKELGIHNDYFVTDFVRD